MWHIRHCDRMAYRTARRSTPVVPLSIRLALPRRLLRPCLCAWAALLLSATAALSQQQNVGGTVLDARTLRPLAGSQIVVEGTQQGTLTDARGRFLITGVQGPEVTLRVRHLGYRTLTETVRTGEVNLRFALEESAIELDEVVVTGTPAGTTQRRAIGNAVSRIQAEQIAELAPVPDIRQLVNARAPGVVIQSSGGFVGQGNKIRIRGLTSLSLTNEPLIYVDGVRLDNTERTGPTFAGRSYISRFNDIDPNQIERIEIIKGPAAATLYGTEASAGVIQIITKRGVQGDPRITVSVEQGANWIMNPEGRFPTGYFRRPDGSIATLNFVQAERERGTPVFRTGHRQKYTAEISGGLPSLTYYLASGYEADEGPLRHNHLDRFTSRLNLSVALTEMLNVEANMGYVRSRLYPGGTGGPLQCAFLPDPAGADLPNRGCGPGVAPPEAFYAALDQWQDLDRFSGGLELSHRPWSWFSQRVRGGIDVVDEENVGLVERLDADIGQFFGRAALGQKSVGLRNATHFTLDYGGTATFRLGEALTSSTSVGAQYFRKEFKFNTVVGEEFPAPGIRVVSSAAIQRGSEDYIHNATVGLYVQQQFGWQDRLFITGAFRGDDNSAFGTDYEFVTYPKLSATWVVSEEPFWRLAFLNTLRLRAAYGQSGLQPDAFAAIRSFEPITGPGNVAAVRPQFIGNPTLGPERGEELEAGFDAALLNDRLGVEFTWYNKRSKDAILLSPVLPSLGFPGLQYVNVGEIRNNGVELLLNARVLDRRDIRLEFGFNVATNENEIVDMGGLPQISLGVLQVHREGYPVGALFNRKVVNAEVDAQGNLTNVLCDGGPANNHQPMPCAQAPAVFVGPITPKVEGAFTTTITILERLALFGMVDFKTGHHLLDANLAIHCAVQRRCLENIDPSVNPIRAAEYANFILPTPDASFTKLRQISATYRVPERLLGVFGSSAATLTVSARNLHTWTRYPGVDPEVWEMHPTQGGLYNQQQLNLPQPAQFLTSIRVTF